MALYRILFVLFFLFLVPTISFADNNKPYDKIVFFGDSLSDNGNLYEYDLGLLPKSPPYFEGRFSNGKTWADLVAGHYSADQITSSNYAVGGESVLFHTPIDKNLPFILEDSINDYLFHNIFKDKSHTLFIIWIGANDYLNGSNDVDEMTSQVVNKIQDNIKKLISKGGAYFLILNLPDLSRTPEAQANGNAQNLSLLTAAHNTKLPIAIKQLGEDYPEAHFQLFDISEVFTTLIEHPEVINNKFQTHITNITDACWPGGYTWRDRTTQKQQLVEALEAQLKTMDIKLKISIEQFANYIISSPDLSAAYQTAVSYSNGVVPCNDPDAYLFWDHVHPTAVAHSIVANILIAYLDQS